MFLEYVEQIPLVPPSVAPGAGGIVSNDFENRLLFKMFCKYSKLKTKIFIQVDLTSNR